MSDLEVSLVGDDSAHLNPAAEEGHENDDLDDLNDAELKPHCMGHHFHWSEVFFAALAVGGFVLMCISGVIDAAPSLVKTIEVIIYVSGAVTATALMWNLVTTKRIAAASEMLLEDVKKFRAQNNRAKDLQEVNKKNDVQMKANLADLDKAALLLKGSVQGLDDISKQEQEMFAEREKLLEDRREIAEKLEVNMNKLWTLTIEAVRTEMERRVMEVFQDLAKPNADDSEDGIVVDSDAWKELIEIIEEYGVAIDHNDTSEHGLLTMAGDDKFLNTDEFETWWTHAEEKHFTKLIAILKRNRDLEDRIRSLELGVPEKTTDGDAVVISV